METRNLLLLFLLVSCCAFLVAAKASSVKSGADPDFTLNIFHVNDIHAHFEEVNEYTGRCKTEMAENGECYGGISRMYTKLNELQNDPDNQPWTFLNAGDYYQGTIWYTLFDWEPVAQFAEYLNYTAMSLGNHEFDDGAAGIVPFAENITFPLLAANLEEVGEPYLSKHYTKSVIVEVDGKRIGIVGYITKWTPSISQPDSTLRFNDEIESVRAEAQRLKTEDDIDIIIALGHGGYYDVDLAMAKEVEEIDVIVGGHSHTFLYSGDEAPSVEIIEGPYPTYVTQDSGKVVPIVQAYCYSKYIGHLRMNFDADGDLMTPVDGVGISLADVILLDHSIDKDPGIEALMDPWRELMTEYITPVGWTEVFLQRLGLEESNIGDCVTDSMAASWPDTTMGFINKGGLRSDILEGEITGEDIFNTLPFNNTIDRLTMKGENIKEVLEDYATGICADQTCWPSFMLFSGLKVIYDIYEDNEWDRVTSMKTLCDGESFIPIGQASPDQLCEVEMDKVYNVSVISFLADGHTRYARFGGKYITRETGESDYDAFDRYVKTNIPITQETEGRIALNYFPGEYVHTTTNPVESTTNPVDVTTNPVDSTTMLVDATTNPVDSTTMLVDATTNPLDYTTMLVDATTNPLDSTTMLVDATTNPKDTTIDPNVTDAALTTLSSINMVTLCIFGLWMSA